MQAFLESSTYINWQSPEIQNQAEVLTKGLTDQVEIVRRCFEFVRDEIKHSYDYALNPVTCVASDVLKEKTGFCFAKSHLLAALLRAKGIPTALLYQRVSAGEGSEAFFWHGLNQVFLNEFGWYRLDSRGIKPGMVGLAGSGAGECTPPLEAIPFQPSAKGEVLLEQRWAEPSAAIVTLLENAQDYQSVIRDLVNIETVVGD